MSTPLLADCHPERVCLSLGFLVCWEVFLKFALESWLRQQGVEGGERQWAQSELLAFLGAQQRLTGLPGQSDVMNGTELRLRGSDLGRGAG